MSVPRRSELDEHAEAIRGLGRRVVRDVVEIGRRLTRCKHVAGHGNWLPWLEREFGWVERTAQRLMNVYDLSERSDNLPDLNLPVSGLYLLAAPSTSEKAREGIIERAETGERLTHAQIKEAIQQEKRGEASPADTGEGRQQPAHKPERAPPSPDRQAAADLIDCIVGFVTALDAIDLKSALRGLAANNRDWLVENIRRALARLEAIRTLVITQTRPAPAAAPASDERASSDKSAPYRPGDCILDVLPSAAESDAVARAAIAQAVAAVGLHDAAMMIFLRLDDRELFDLHDRSRVARRKEISK